MKKSIQLHHEKITSWMKIQNLIRFSKCEEFFTIREVTKILIQNQI